MPVRIILGGPPHSGKSTLAVRITYALQDIGIDSSFKDLDLWSQTIDLILGNMTPEEKEEHKRKDVTEDEISRAVQEFESLSENHVVVIGDGPGGISHLSELIFKSATHGIIVCKEDDAGKIGEWNDLFRKHGVPVVAIIISKLAGTEQITSSNPVVHAEINGLDKTVKVTPITIRIAYLLRVILQV